MKLISFKYSEFEGGDKEWNLSESTFDDVNLIVGKNASGKSRTINVITSFAALISGSRKELFSSGSYFGTFIRPRDKKKITYEIILKDNEVEKETLNVSRKTVLQRDSKGNASLNFEKERKSIKVKVPKDILVLVARRDPIQHPFFEELYEWARSVKKYSFGSSLGKDTVSLIDSPIEQKENLFSDAARVVDLFKDGLNNFGENFHKNIKNDFSHLGYEITEVGLITTPQLHIKGTPAAMLYVKERDLKTETSQLYMSQGMFRALSLIIQMNYTILSKVHTCILIDDIGEGLDFERSTKLIKMLTKISLENNIQLFLTSNDRFVMNNVDLKYWSIISRNGPNVTIYNRFNSEERFKEFEYMGLSNFDFFASDYFLEDFGG